MSPAVITLIVLGIVALLFVTEAVPLPVTALGGAISLGLLGIIPSKTVWSGLSNSTVVLFAGMFVIGAAMFRTGLAQRLGEMVVKKTGKSEVGLMLGTMFVAAGLSSVASNTGMTAALMPVILGICVVANTPASRQMMPLAFAAGLGGIITLVGTPPNIIASGVLETGGFEPFGFFEFAWIGIPLTVVGILYMVFIGRRFLPTNELPVNAVIDADASAEATATSNDPKKQAITASILLAVVIVMGLNVGWLPLEMAAVIGAILCVVTGCLTEKEAYYGIDWTTIFLFAGMLPIAAAMESSGAGQLIADLVIGVLGDTPSPIFITAVLFALSAGLTQFMSNTASTALLAPIGLSIAVGIHASPYAVLMAIAVSASCAFATPVGTPPNTLVLGPGGYKFMDYVKVGTPLVVLCFIVSIVIIPLVWPFFPSS